MRSCQNDLFVDALIKLMFLLKSCKAKERKLKVVVSALSCFDGEINVNGWVVMALYFGWVR